MSRSHPLVRPKGTRRTQPKHTATSGRGQRQSQRQSGCYGALRSILLILGLGVLLIAALFVIVQTGPNQTFLIIGMDQRPDESGPARSDVILLLHVDRERGQTALVSIPRDLWLQQPGGVTNRVNTAMVTGYTATDPHSAPRYLIRTLESNFRVPIDGYFLLNFDAFLHVVDAVGGVEVDVPTAIVDPAYPTEDYGVQTIRFDAGPQHLDAERALIYVRTRHQDSDFGRSVRQQQVIQALANKMMQPQSWPRIPAVVAAVWGSVQSDAGLSGTLSMAMAAYYLATGEVETLILNRDYVIPWTTEGGAYVLLPQWEVIRPTLDLLFVDSVFSTE
jgi:polyisoprenyl-teichoic acid--peptidoglycan teichoic acid transferase